jgi:lipopolysaccharide/colanic/teichoic acid biosynthesis glycosyltransferase
MKRFIDIALLLVFLPIVLLLFFIVAILVKINLGSPIFFSQKRPGLNGNIFDMIKFRTMANSPNKDDNLFNDASRLNKFGKLLRSSSLDEIPSLWNVLKGDMSFVGPRPLLVEYLPLYNKKQARRHLVRPGITGWAQVNGRNAISWEEKFDLDVWYVDNNTILLDLKILLLTLKKVLLREDISHENNATMYKFKGNQNESR